jgi:hypothetical protein
MHDRTLVTWWRFFSYFDYKIEASIDCAEPYADRRPEFSPLSYLNVLAPGNAPCNQRRIVDRLPYFLAGSVNNEMVFDLHSGPRIYYRTDDRPDRVVCPDIELRWIAFLLRWIAFLRGVYKFRRKS